jgi:hypothetical protein
VYRGRHCVVSGFNCTLATEIAIDVIASRTPVKLGDLGPENPNCTSVASPSCLRQQRHEFHLLLTLEPPERDLRIS